MSLSTELWHTIMLDSPKVYYLLSQVCVGFKINQSIAKRALTIMLCIDNKIMYHLPNNKLHREDGPAIIHADGSQEWYINNKLHREDGPAIIYANGSQEWWLNGKKLR